jgi:hypothetical protein
MAPAKLYPIRRSKIAPNKAVRLQKASRQPRHIVSVAVKPLRTTELPLLGRRVGKIQVVHPSPEHLSQRPVFTVEPLSPWFLRQNCGGHCTNLVVARKVTVFAAAHYLCQLQPRETKIS